MTANVEVIPPDRSIREAAQLLRDLEVGSLPVCNGDRIVGMITDRDIAIRIVAQGLDPEKTSVATGMTPQVVWCYEDQSLAEAGEIMKREQIRRLPVISREKKLVGILTLGDLAIKGEDPENVGVTLQEISEISPAVNP